jgi:hypothetical protein
MNEDQNVSTKQYEAGPQRFEREFASRQAMFYRWTQHEMRDDFMEAYFGVGDHFLEVSE